MTRCAREHNGSKLCHRTPVLQIAGNTIEEAIQSETSGNLQKAFLVICAMTRDLHEYYAQKLHDAMRGLGTHEDVLTRSEVRQHRTRLTY